MSILNLYNWQYDLSDDLKSFGILKPLFISFPTTFSRVIFPAQQTGSGGRRGRGRQDGFTCPLCNWSVIHLRAAYVAWFPMGYRPGLSHTGGWGPLF